MGRSLLPARLAERLGARPQAASGSGGDGSISLTRHLPTMLLVLGFALTALIGYWEHRSAVDDWRETSRTAGELLLLTNRVASDEIRADLHPIAEEVVEGTALLEAGEDPGRVASTTRTALGPLGIEGLQGVIAGGEQGSSISASDITVAASLSALQDRIVDAVDARPSDVNLVIDLAPELALGLRTGSGWVLVLVDRERFLSAGQADVTATVTQITPLIDDRASTATSEPLAATSTIAFGDDAFVIRSELVQPYGAAPQFDLTSLPLLAGFAITAAAYLLVRAVRRAEDVAALHASEAREAHREASLRLSRTFASSPIGMAELDQKGAFVEVNPALGRQIGRSPESLLGMPLTAIIHPEDLTQYQRKVSDAIRGTKPVARSEHRYTRPDGSVVWVDESLTVVADEDGTFRCLLLQAEDITTRRQAVNELAWKAFHDDLTGLPNRALFLDRLRNAVDRVSRQAGLLAVMFVDIDRFKVVNDSLGHKTGDRLLMEIARRLSRAVRTGDTVARFGGDEFVVLCENVVSHSEALWIAQRMQQVLAEPLESISGLRGSGYATASIGITLCESAASSAEDLLRDADAAMYRAKENGRNRVELFDAALRYEVVARLEIEGQLRAALEGGEMVLHYQAIVDADTEQPAGYEALIRWHHPEKGLLGPSAFLHVAEDAGVMHLIDTWVLRQTCTQIAEWTAAFPEFRQLYVSTNWSARNLERFAHLVEEVLAETRIDPSQLVIEVTEGFLLEDSTAAMGAIGRLKALGVRVAIDDFGTGYSSLSYLTQLEVDFLKIDKSFVHKLPEDAAAAIVGAIADMAHRLGIGLIAEGVETDDQLRFLRSLGSPRLQGYRFSKPRWASEVAEGLAHRYARAELKL